MSHTNKITQGPIAPQLMAFFLPIWLGTFFQQLYTTVDAMVVGNFVGKEALAAVGGPTGLVVNLLVGFFVGTASGASIIIAQYFGARKEEETSRAVHTAFAFAIVCGVVLMVVGFLCSDWVLRAMGTPADVMPAANTYLRIYFIGTVFNLVYNIGSASLRALGDSRRPLYFLMAASGTNVVLDLLFVAVMKMGVAGAALATVLSQVVSAVLVVLSLRATNQCYKLHLSKIRLHADVLKSIVRLGLPTGAQSVLYTFSNIIIQSSINAFGTDTVAAWSAYGKMDGLFWMTISSLGIAVTTFMGQNFGAKQYDRCKKIVRTGLLISFGITVLLSCVLLLLGPWLFRLFTQDTDVIEEGVLILHYLVPVYFTYVFIEILSGALRGAGDVVVPMVMTCLGVAVLRAVWIAVAIPLWPTLFTACLSYPISWAVTSVAFILYYYCSKWMPRAIARTEHRLSAVGPAPVQGE